MKVIISFQSTDKYRNEIYDASWLIVVTFDVLGRLVLIQSTKPTARQIRRLKKQAKARIIYGESNG